MPKVIQPTQRINAGDMSQATVTSAPLDGRYVDNIKWLLVWTGTPTGSLSLQISMDHNPAIDSTNGTWYDDGANITGPAGGAGSAIINLSDRAPCFYRVVYTRTGGTGILNAWASGSGPL